MSGKRARAVYMSMGMRYMGCTVGASALGLAPDRACDDQDGQHDVLGYQRPIDTAQVHPGRLSIAFVSVRLQTHVSAEYGAQRQE
jgi:hypothetical protein